MLMFIFDDATTESGCLLVAPRSHYGSETSQETSVQGFNYSGMEPMLMKSGDVLRHNGPSSSWFTSEYL